MADSPGPRRTPSDNSRAPLWLMVAAVLAVGGYLGWRQWQQHQASLVVAPATAPVPAVPDTPAAPIAAIPSPPAIQHPIDPPAPDASANPMPGLADADPYVSERLIGLLGRPDVMAFLQLDGFVRRAVATVDNLARDTAPVSVWPVNPTPGRFATAPAANGGTEAIEAIAPTNAARYTPFVRFVESVDTAQAVALYRRLYPLFQQAHEEQGFPGRYFNDRLVQVLDLLIATPVPAQPPTVTLVEVKGDVPSTRPWVRYEFADPALESLSAGQKMLLRTGADNHQRLRTKLIDIRQRIARP
ncbi:MAG: DUF3014 domain-containing protein [Hydrogenophaga sp.]|nr:DUF3014 domain-containing protein [Hydrogenophaga sp.]